AVRTGHVISQPGWNASARQNSSAARVSMSPCSATGRSSIAAGGHFLGSWSGSKLPSAHFHSIAIWQSPSTAFWRGLQTARQFIASPYSQGQGTGELASVSKLRKLL